MKVKNLAILAATSIVCVGLISCSSGTSVNSSSETGETVSENSSAKKSKSAPAVYIESSSGLAIRGTDPVAYFTQEKAVEGSSEFEYEWQGATWRFASAEHQQKFAENPEAYAPQYGGYCAKGLSEGNVVSIDPEAWKIVEGKLYLNYSPNVQKQWIGDIPGNIAKANANWPSVLVGATVYE